MSKQLTMPLYSLEVLDPSSEPVVLSIVYSHEIRSGHKALLGRLSGPDGQPVAETTWSHRSSGRNAALEILKCMVRDLEDMTDPF